VHNETNTAIGLSSLRGMVRGNPSVSTQTKEKSK